MSVLLAFAKGGAGGNREVPPAQENQRQDESSKSAVSCEVPPALEGHDGTPPASWGKAPRAILPVMRTPSHDRTSPNLRVDLSTIIIEPSTALVGPSTIIIEPSTALVGPPTVVIEPSTGIIEPSTGIIEPSTGLVEPSTVIIEPSTVIIEPSTRLVEWPIEGEQASDGRSQVSQKG